MLVALRIAGSSASYLYTADEIPIVKVRGRGVKHDRFFGDSYIGYRVLPELR